MSGNNYSIHSIIAAYGLGIAPHGYYIVKMTANAKGQSSNILYVPSIHYKMILELTQVIRPRENLSNLKGRIAGQLWDKLARARGAHLNALEGIPMFAAAMVSLFTLIYSNGPKLIINFNIASWKPGKTSSERLELVCF